MTRRNAKSAWVLASLGIGLVLGSLGTARAQPILKRLEQRIRSRVDASEEASEPASPQGATEAGQEEGPGAVGPKGRSTAPSSNFEPGYLGLVADDQGEENRGVRVLEVRPAGPAEKAGFKKGDLITSVAEIRVRSLADMADIMELFPPGKTVAFEVLRAQTQQQVSATLGRRPGAAAAPPQAVTAERPSDAPPQLDVPPEPAPPAGPVPGESPSEGGVALPRAERPTIERPLPPPEQPPTIDELLQRIEALERRVVELEQALGEPSRPKP